MPLASRAQPCRHSVHFGASGCLVGLVGGRSTALVMNGSPAGWRPTTMTAAAVAVNEGASDDDVDDRHISPAPCPFCP